MVRPVHTDLRRHAYVEDFTVAVREHLPAATFRLRFEAAMHAVVPGNGFEQFGWCIGGQLLIR